MKQTKQIMGMPVTVEIIDNWVVQKDFDQIFDYFYWVDQKFSTFKTSSEISMINDGRLKIDQASNEMKNIFKLAKQTKKETNGYFDIQHQGQIDPSGIVKGWAIFEAAKQLKQKGFKNFYLDVGSDIQVSGQNSQGKKWRVGIRNPFNVSEIVKTIEVENEGVATSGIYERGDHIYRPASAGSASFAFNPKQILEAQASQDDIFALCHSEELRDVESQIVSLTIIGPNIYEADRFTTAAFAMGKKGIEFVENLPGFEGYLIDKNGKATMTSGFEKYIPH